MAQPNSNSSIYVEWNATTPNTDPLLLRYEVTYIDLAPSQENETTSTITTKSLLSGSRSAVIEGLRPNAMYEVSVAATSLVGRSQERHMPVSTFPNGESSGCGLESGCGLGVWIHYN